MPDGFGSDKQNEEISPKSFSDGYDPHGGASRQSGHGHQAGNSAGGLGEVDPAGETATKAAQSRQHDPGRLVVGNRLS
jgi:hypothetical protein